MEIKIDFDEYKLLETIVEKANGYDDFKEFGLILNVLFSAMRKKAGDDIMREILKEDSVDIIRFINNKDTGKW